MMAMNQKSKPFNAGQLDEIASVRERYYILVQDGFTPTEAAAIAEGRKPMPKKLPPMTRAQRIAADLELASKENTKLPSSSNREVLRTSSFSVSVPPGWEDLPWPKLQKLASSLEKGVEVKSRKQANQIILSHLVEVSGDDED